MATTFALALGGTIIKSLAKSVYGDGLPVELFDSLVDVLKDRGMEVDEARMTARRLERLRDRVVVRLESLIEHEVAHLGEESWLAIVREAEVTLSQAGDATMVVEAELLPEKLRDMLVQSRPEVKAQLSGQEYELYERLLAQAAECLIEVSPDMKNFERTFGAALLRRQRELHDDVRQLVYQSTAEIAPFEAEYRKVVADVLDRLEMFGMRPLDDIIRRQNLSIAYVTLDVNSPENLSRAEDVEEREIRSRDDIENGAETLGSSLSQLARRFPTVSSQGPVDQVLSRTARAVIRGEPGSGKTTLLRWLAVHSARQDFPAVLAGWNYTVPFFIRLRECIESGFPPPERFVRLIAEMIADEMPQGWVQAQLRAGRALVLVDGVDELPRDKREPMLEELRRLMYLFPSAHYIVTSRTEAVKEWPEWAEWIHSAGLTEITLQPMTTSQIQTFVENWHQALWRTLDPVERSELNGLPDSLLEALRARPQLRALATNPLLCAMICALNRDRRRSLPAERIELYRACVEILLSRRDEGRGLPLDRDYPKLGYLHKLALIQGFAYWLTRNDLSDAEIGEADRRFQALLQTMNLPGVTGEGVRRLFVHRTGLLTEPVEGRVHFQHRTFQEFLAAQAAVSAGDFRLLLSRAGDDTWREVIILAMGEARPREREDMLKELVSRAENQKDEAQRNALLLLAVACLETCIQLDPMTRALVLEKAMPLFPPEEPAQARVVAVAGEPAIPLLVYSPDYTEKQAGACILALAQIGGEAALDSIGSYASDERDEPLRAIGLAWESFDRDLYVRRVLARSKRLWLPTLSSWALLSRLSHLSGLIVDDASGLRDLDGLAMLPKLRLLAMGRLNKCNEFGSLAGLMDLEYLDLDGVTITSVEMIAGLIGLRHLDIRGTRVSNLKPLSRLVGLRRLHVGNTGVSELQPLADLANLWWLDISETVVKDVRPLARLTGLYYLNIGETQVTDAAPLVNLTGLQILDIHNAPIVDVRPLVELVGLKRLYASTEQAKTLESLPKRQDLKIIPLEGR